MDRTASKVEGTKATDFNYLGLSGEVLSEEVAGKVTASYQYSPWGQRLSQVRFNPDNTSEDGYYGYNPHWDVESLTGSAGDAKATYGYTAYGKDDESRFTGVDKPDVRQPGKEPYNVYRVNAKRWNPGSQSYDMGFRDYSPGLNRFLTRDAYNGALADLNLGMDPWTANRYAFTGGNPISRIELDGHSLHRWYHRPVDASVLWSAMTNVMSSLPSCASCSNCPRFSCTSTWRARSGGRRCARSRRRMDCRCRSTWRQAGRSTGSGTSATTTR